MSRYRKALCLATALVLVAGPTQAGKLGLGRDALPEEIAAWDIDVRPDGQGLPPGSGSVKDGETVFLEKCASCHGEFGEGAGRWPVLAGGQGSLKGASPEKTMGSFWPYLSTTYDYVKRAMPYGQAQTLTDDEIYALTAFLLSMNDLVKDDFVLTRENFATIRLPNEGGFYPDDRETAEKHFWKAEPCMTDCKSKVEILGHARSIDVTPEDEGKGMKVE